MPQADDLSGGRGRGYDSRCAEHRESLKEFRDILSDHQQGTHSVLEQKVVAVDVRQANLELRLNRLESDIWIAVDKVREGQTAMIGRIGWIVGMISAASAILSTSVNIFTKG